MENPCCLWWRFANSVCLLGSACSDDRAGGPSEAVNVAGADGRCYGGPAGGGRAHRVSVSEHVTLFHYGARAGARGLYQNPWLMMPIGDVMRGVVARVIRTPSALI